MKSPLTIFILFLSSFCLQRVSASFNFTNSTRLPIHGSYLHPAYLANSALATRYIAGTGISSFNFTNSINATLSPPQSTPNGAAPQEPAKATPVPPQQPKASLLPGSPPSASAAAVTQPSTAQPDETSTPATPKPVAAPTENAPVDNYRPDVPLLPQPGIDTGPVNSINNYRPDVPSIPQPETDTEPVNSVNNYRPGVPLIPQPGTDTKPVNIDSEPEHSASSPGPAQPAPGPSLENSGDKVSAFKLTAGTDMFAVTPGPSSQYVISSKTLTPGGSVTVNNVPIFLPSQGSSIVIGTSTVPFQPSQPSINTPLAPAFITVANTPIPIRTSGSALIVDDSSVLTPGGAITINNVAISLPVSGSSILIGSSTVDLHLGPSPPITPSIPTPSVTPAVALSAGGVITIANSPVSYQRSGSALVIGGSSTLNPGSTITVDNVPVFLPTAGSSLVIGGKTVLLISSPQPTTPPGVASPLIIQGQTLTPGGVITVSNTPISLPSSGSALIIGGSSTVPVGGMQTVSIGSQGLVVSQAGSFSDLVIDGHTVAPNSQAVVSGVTVSVLPQATGVVIDASTTAGLGGAILSALGISPSTVSAAGAPNGTLGSGIAIQPTSFTGAASSKLRRTESWWFGWRIGLTTSFCWWGHFAAVLL